MQIAIIIANLSKIFKLKKFLLSPSIIAGKIFKIYLYNISTINKNRDL